MKELMGKTILITGGTGSFGKTVVQRLLDTDVGEVRVFSRDELKQELMRIELNNSKVRFYIGDVREKDSVNNVMKGVDYVFHAAALKQVPSCEFFPMQAVFTNILGSRNVIESAIKNKVKNVVCLSTDKAVYPINAMGMTKALMEKVVRAVARGQKQNETIICCVRYGNVVYSRGSVIPLFVRQIMKKEQLTITEAEMTRFFLSLKEAIELVLFAFENANQGDIFIRKAAAGRIIDLAAALKNIFRSDIEIKKIGMRHGEKIFETLATREELSLAEDMGDYYRVKMDDRQLDYNKYFTKGDIEEYKIEDYTSHNTQRLSIKEIEKLLLNLPEIKSELKAFDVSV